MWIYTRSCEIWCRDRYISVLQCIIVWSVQQPYQHSWLMRATIIRWLSQTLWSSTCRLSNANHMILFFSFLFFSSEMSLSVQWPTLTELLFPAETNSYQFQGRVKVTGASLCDVYIVKSVAGQMSSIVCIYTFSGSDDFAFGLQISCYADFLHSVIKSCDVFLRMLNLIHCLGNAVWQKKILTNGKLTSLTGSTT